MAIRPHADPIDIVVGQRLRAFRLARKISQVTLGAGVGISFQQVQKYETGSNRISASMMCKLAAALEIDPAELLPPEVRDKGTVIADLLPFQSTELVEIANIFEALPPKSRTAVVKAARMFALAEAAKELEA